MMLSKKKSTESLISGRDVSNDSESLGSAVG